ncbi:MAG: hypothetical protein CR968_05065 [Flavobacteriia bacterium]|nr:MAG: hypothetical protein CR968_05065 [Flavobacteriia bacterium]
MRTLMYTISLIVFTVFMSSCYQGSDYYQPTLEEVMTDYDIWYVNYNSTTGTGNIPMLSKAFTITFKQGRVYANNNLVGIGQTGNGYGIQIGTYNTQNGYLIINHDTDGSYAFEVIADTPQSIRLYNSNHNVTYFLEGYHASQFDFDQVFYDNIEYFLQEYIAWEKTYTSQEGTPNEFDNENYLAFTPENITTFYSSKDNPGMALDDIIWDYTGSYEVYDVNGYDNLKIIKLFYEGNGYETFELVVLNDGTIELYHVDSGTTYEFSGRGFIQYKQPGKKATTERQRTKVHRKTIERSSVKK